MTPVELTALAASTSLLAGWRLYLVTLVTGLAMKFGWIAMPDQLHALDVLANNWVLGAAAVGTFAEFFADKIFRCLLISFHLRTGDAGSGVVDFELSRFSGHGKCFSSRGR